jgi:hypothetical protein
MKPEQVGEWGIELFVTTPLDLEIFASLFPSFASVKSILVFGLNLGFPHRQ